MAENPNADYHNILKEKPDVEFIDLYEEAINRIACELLPLELVEILAEKRAFGIEKYGDDCFQATLTNAVNSPVFDHLADELVDAFNYMLHLYYVAGLKGDKQTETMLLNVGEGLLFTCMHLKKALQAQRNLPASTQKHLQWVTAIPTGEEEKSKKPNPPREEFFMDPTLDKQALSQTEKIPLRWALNANPNMQKAVDQLDAQYSKTHTPDVTDPKKPFAVRYCSCGSDNLVLERKVANDGTLTHRYICGDCGTGKSSPFIDDHFQAAKFWAGVVDSSKGK